MKLYFNQPITDTNKIKFLEFFSKRGYQYSAKELFTHIYLGYFETNNYKKSLIEELESLDIWKKPRKFGRFWDESKELCSYGFLYGIDNSDIYKYQKTNEYGDKYSKYINFEEITDLKELQ